MNDAPLRSIDNAPPTTLYQRRPTNNASSSTTTPHRRSLIYAPSASLLDLDGALFLGAPARADALGAALGGEGVGADAVGLARVALWPADEAVRALAGDALDETARELVALRVERDYAERAAGGGLPLAVGGRAALDALGAAVRLGAVTRLPRAAAERLLAFAELRDAFAVLVAADDRVRGGGEARWRLAYERLAPRVPGLTPARTAALVADAHGAELATRAGLRAVRVGHESGLPLAGLTPAGLAAAASGADSAPPAPDPCTTPRP